MHVAGYGPANAKLVVIGEAPGQEETRLGRPFVGPSGTLLRRALTTAGYDPEAVRYDNVVPYNPGRFPKGRACDELIAANIDRLDTTLASPHIRAVLLAGGIALRGVTGWSSIRAWHGAMLTKADGRAPRRALCGSTLIFPVVHPAAILRDPRRVMLETFLTCVRHAVHVAQGGQIVRPLPTVIHASPTDLAVAFRHADGLVVDCEYDIATYKPHHIGLATPTDPLTVYAIPELSIPAYRDTLTALLRHRRFIAHNAAADLRALAAAGVDTAHHGVIFDTMQIHALLEPDLTHDLSFAVRTTIPGIVEWKHLRGEPGLTEAYNAYDVAYTGLLLQELWRELTACGMDHVYFAEVEPNILRMAEIERRGLRVDAEAQVALRAAYDEQIAAATETLRELTASAIAERIETLTTAVGKTETAIASLLENARSTCRMCPDCAGRKKPYTWRMAPRCPACAAVYSAMRASIDDKLTTLRKKRTTQRNLLRAVEEHGFRPGNDEDLRWFIMEVLKRRTGRRTEKGKVSVDVEALDTLTDNPVVAAAWTVKHAQKMKSTFLDVPVDADGLAHPPARMHGTSTGRPTSGKDLRGDAEAEEETFNAFNIPEPLRRIYVPHPGHTFVQLDYKDLEGRLVALDSGDSMLCDLYTRGVDVHSHTASVLFAIDPDAAPTTKITIGLRTESARFWAKRVAHGWRYGMGPGRLAQMLRVTKNDASRLMERYGAAFPGVVAFQQRIRHQVFGEARREDSGALVVVRRGEHVLYTAVRRRRRYLGSEEALIKEALAQRPQSHGATVWYTTVDRLCWPRSTDLRCGVGRLVLGTYDSFLLELPSGDTAVVAWAVAVAQEPMTMFAKLPGAAKMPLTFPVDVKRGDDYSFGKILEITTP